MIMLEEEDLLGDHSLRALAPMPEDEPESEMVDVEVLGKDAGGLGNGDEQRSLALNLGPRPDATTGRTPQEEDPLGPGCFSWGPTKPEWLEMVAHSDEEVPGGEAS